MIKVLVVDDDEDLLEMVSMMLRTNNMNVYSVAKGEEVFTSLGNFQPDIVLMDIYLGDRDGRHICKEIKADGKYSMLPVLLYSAGNISNGSIAEAGADYFIQKPFEMKALITRIREISSVKER